MEPTDEHYLNPAVIETVFQGTDRILQSRVFTSMERKYKRHFLERVAVRRHYLLSAETLAAVAEQAFSEMQRIFYDKVCNREFRDDGSPVDAYLFTIFRNAYLNFYRAEMTYKKYDAEIKKRGGSAVKMHADLPAYNKPEGIYKLIRAAAVQNQTPAAGLI